MPNDVLIKTIKINLDDLKTYQDSLPAGTIPPAITNLAVLNSELGTKGLSALNSSLNSGNKPTIEEIRYATNTIYSASSGK